METIAERLKNLRTKAGYSQQFVAEQVGVERTTYVKWENGSSNPTKKISELASLFNVSADYILGVNNSQNPTPTLKETETLKKQIEAKQKRAQQAYDILIELPPEMQKAAIAQLKALAALNDKS